MLTFQGRGSQSNPPAVATDQKGRAVLAGLAMGSWQVEVKHPDFLSYVAVFDLDRGKKPSINASFLEAGGRSLTPMKVKLSKGNPRDASPPLPAREARTQAPPPAEPDRPTAEAESAPTPPTIEATPAEPTSDAEPAVQEVAEPRPQPEPEVQVATQAETPSVTDRPTAREDSPTPEPEVAELPEPEAEPEKEELPAPEPTSPATVAQTAPIAQAPEPEAEPTLAADRIGTEPDVISEAPSEATAIPEEPPRPEPVEASETATELAEATAPRTTEPVPAPPGPADQEPTVEVAQAAEEPLELQPESMPDDPADQLAVPSEVTEEALSPAPAAAEAVPVLEEVEVDSAPSQEAEAPLAETVTPPRVPVPRREIPSDVPTISSYRDGSCSECRTGEWAVTTLQAVAAGSTPCPAGVSEAARESADSLGNSMQLELSGFVGPVADGSNSEALDVVEPEISRAYEQSLADYLGGTSNCQVVSVVLPKSVRFVGFRYEAFDGRGGGECAPDRGCTLPQAQWLANPVVQRGFSATVVWGIFENTAPQSPRTARLKVYFRTPNSRWQPPTR